MRKPVVPKLKRRVLGQAMIFAVAVCLLLPSAVMAQIKELKIGIGVDADTLNPQEQTTTLFQNICDLIYGNMYFQDPKGDVHPALLTGHEVSADGLTWTLHIREGVKFIV